MHEFHRMMLSAEVSEFAEEVARLFDDLERRPPDRSTFVSGSCAPLLDVVESDTAVSIVMDLAGVEPRGVRVLIKAGTVLIVGEKLPADPAERADATFHLVERSFGRFARGVHLTTAIDASRARGHLRGGELRIVIPKIAERRGREIVVPIDG